MLTRADACQEFAGVLGERVVKQAAVKHYCDDSSLRAGEHKELCGYLCISAYSVALTDAWVSCQCKASGNGSQSNLPEWISQQECCNCHQQCSSNELNHGKSWIPPYCWSHAFSKPEVRSKVLPLQKQQCNEFAFGQSSYACRSFSKNKRPYSNRSCR